MYGCLWKLHTRLLRFDSDEDSEEDSEGDNSRMVGLIKVSRMLAMTPRRIVVVMKMHWRPIVPRMIASMQVSC